MNALWKSLSLRERLSLILAAVLLVITSFYLAIWEPFYARLQTLRQTVAEERIQVAWMEQAAIEARALQGGVVITEKTSGESLLALVDRSARAAGMGAALNRVEPEGKDKVRVWLNDIAFDTLIPWLAELNKIQGIISESLVVDRQTAPGLVNARLVLVGGGDV